MINDNEHSQINFTVDTKLKKAFQKVVGKKYMSYKFRKYMERIVKEANKIHHA